MKLVEKIMKHDKNRRKRIEAAGVDYECPEIVWLTFSLLQRKWSLKTDWANLDTLDDGCWSTCHEVSQQTAVLGFQVLALYNRQPS